jgi:hypothetical protein
MRFRSINVRRPPGHTVFHPLKIYGSKRPGSSCGYPGMLGRQVPFVRTFPENRSSPLGDEGPSSSVVSFVINVGPALGASAFFPRLWQAEAILPSVRKRSLPSSLQLRSTSFLNLLDVVCVFHFDRNPHNSCGPEIGCLHTIKPLAAQHDPGSPRVHRRSVRGWRRPHCPLPVEHCGHRRSLR